MASAIRRLTRTQTGVVSLAGLSAWVLWLNAGELRCSFTDVEGACVRGPGFEWNPPTMCSARPGGSKGRETPAPPSASAEDFVAGCMEAVSRMPFSPGDGNNWKCVGGPENCTTPSGEPALRFFTDFSGFNLEWARLWGLPVFDKQDVAVDVGGNTGQDTRWVVQQGKGPGRGLHVFEALPTYQEVLRQTFAEVPAVHVQPYGLGPEDATVTFEVDQGSSQPAKSSSKDLPTTQVRIRNVTAVLGELGLSSTPIRLWTMNCEGCEFRLLRRLVADRTVERIETLQFATHYLPEAFPTLKEDYCRAVEGLRRTHRMVWGVPWCWERWVRLTARERPAGLESFAKCGGWGRFESHGEQGLLVSTGSWDTLEPGGQSKSGMSFFRQADEVLGMSAYLALWGDAAALAWMKAKIHRSRTVLVGMTEVPWWRLPPCGTRLCAKTAARPCDHWAVKNISAYRHGVHVPSVALGCVWSSKLALLQRSSKHHPEFEFHMWIDIGCSFELLNNPADYNLTSVHGLPRYKVSVSLNARGDCEACRQGWKYCTCISGSSYTVPARMLSHMVHIYAQKFEECMSAEKKEGEWICMSDDVILTKLYLSHPELFQVVARGRCGVASALKLLAPWWFQV